RHNVLSFQSMSLMLIVVWLKESFKCQDICEQRKWTTLEKVISENSSYRYSQHYMYLQSISIDQSPPAVNTRFGEPTKDWDGTSKLSFKYYNSQVESFGISFYGFMYIRRKINLGYIQAFRAKNIVPKFKIFNDKELFAVRWFINQEVDGKQLTATVTCLIHPNGKIVLYYDNIPPKIKGIEWKPKIVGKFSCGGKDGTESQVTTPETWIKSGTLMEYEPIGNYCPIYTSSEECQRATTSNITCFWCDKANICIDDTDQDAHNTKVNNCHAKNPDVNDLSTQTTEETDQHSNMTTDVNKENLEKKSSWYLYIVIPLIITFVGVCVGFLIWRWLHKRNRSEE
ncbi:hypothetical protein MS3_00010001, partial [Schistosoma haematobium]